MPGIIEWPNMIKENRVSNYPVVTSDFLPTIMDLLDLTPTHPDWVSDGSSIMGVINGSLSEGAKREKPLNFKAGD